MTSGSAHFSAASCSFTVRLKTSFCRLTKPLCMSSIAATRQQIRQHRSSEELHVRRRRPGCAPLRVAAASGEAPEHWNPQNVPKPNVLPNPSFTPAKAVCAQLDAVKMNDTPRESHGIAVMYEFAMDAGSMERSRYFGFSKDLYHMDHFLNIRTFYPVLFRLQKYEVISEKEDGDRARVDVRLTDIAGGETADFVFSMEKQNFGSYKGCWLTKSLLPADSKWLS